MILLRTEPNIGIGIAVAIFITIIIPSIVFLYKFLREKTGFFSEKYSKLLKLKNQLSDIERQISSYKKIEETGSMSEIEKKEWINLTKDHKVINDKIISIKNNNKIVNIQYDSNPTDTYSLEKNEQLKVKKYNDSKYSKFNREKDESIEEYTKRLNNDKSFFNFKDITHSFIKKGDLKLSIDLKIEERILLEKIVGRDNGQLFLEIGKIYFTNYRLIFNSKKNTTILSYTDIFKVNNYMNLNGFGILIKIKDRKNFKIITGLSQRNRINKLLNNYIK